METPCHRKSNRELHRQGREGHGTRDDGPTREGRDNLTSGQKGSDDPISPQVVSDPPSGPGRVNRETGRTGSVRVRKGRPTQDRPPSPVGTVRKEGRGREVLGEGGQGTESVPRVDGLGTGLSPTGVEENGGWTSQEQVPYL